MISTKLMERADLFCKIMTELSGFDPRKKSRRRGVVTARMIVVNALRDKGATQEQVGELFKKNACTIHYYEERMRNISWPGWEPEKELYDKFKKAINELDQIENKTPDNQEAGI